jgi:RsiW-degrading membrane proteinase PrsW (M82 family)
VLRSIAAVVAGYVVFGASAAILFSLTGRDPHAPAPMAFLIWTTIYGMVFAAAGGCAAAAIAPRKPRVHAAIVGALIALGAVVSLVAAPSDARWSQLAALFLMAPAAAAGGMLRRRHG